MNNRVGHMTYETYDAPTTTIVKSAIKVGYGSLAIGAAGLWAYRNGKIEQGTATISLGVLCTGFGYALGVVRSAFAYGSE